MEFVQSRYSLFFFFLFCSSETLYCSPVFLFGGVVEAALIRTKHFFTDVQTVQMYAQSQRFMLTLGSTTPKAQFIKFKSDWNILKFHLKVHSLFQ